MIKNIIFDFDGVLVDSEILVSRAFCKYLYDRNIRMNEKDFSIYVGKKTFQVVDELSKKFNIINKENFFRDIMIISNKIYEKELLPIAGAKSFLEEQKYNYFIGSNSVTKRIMKGLQKVKFDKFFDQNKIFSFDNVKKPKPDPDIYLEVIKSYSLIKSETIIIEDSFVGVKAGVAAGMKVIGITAGEHWQNDRSKKELLNAGAISIINNYADLELEIKKYD